METTVQIPGIHCASCAALIKDVSGDFPSIKNVDVNIDTKQVTLEHDDTFNLQEWSDEVEALDEKYNVESISQS